LAWSAGRHKQRIARPNLRPLAETVQILKLRLVGAKLSDDAG